MVVLLIVRLIMAFGQSACDPLALSIISDYFPSETRGIKLLIF
jgi:MFS family permease